MAFDRSTVKNLPQGAGVQVIRGKPYVYFRYDYSENGKIKTSRDYLGVVENNVFVPNDYFLRLHPTFDSRPAERCKNKQQGEQPQQSDAVESDEAKEIQTKSVGVTALVACILRENGLIDDVMDLFEGDRALATKLLNIALGAAITAKPTYLSADESAVQMFFNNHKCPTSPRASELHRDIGQTLDLSARISKRRIQRLATQPMLALDGSRMDCNSNNVLDAAVGKRKDGSYGRQINYSILVDAKNGSPVGYRWFSGATNDISTIEDFTSIWNAYGLIDKDPLIVVDRGYYSQDGLVKLGNQGYRFLAGAKTGYNLVKSIIDERNSDFYAAQTLLESANYYGIQEHKTIKSQAGSLDVTVNVFRNPVEEMAETRRLFKRLSQFEADWIEGKADRDDDLIGFYVKPVKGRRLKRDMQTVSNECYSYGYFAFVTNTEGTLSETLQTYSLRNEAEVVFKLMLGNLMRTTRAHSTQALEGLLFTTFIALGILTDLRFRMRRYFGNQTINSTFTIAELMARLKKIQVVTIEGKQHLINVSAKDKKLIKALGFDGLYDSVDKVKSALNF